MTNTRGVTVTNPREILDIHEESTMELEKEDYINEHGSYIINISSNPCSYEKSPKSIGLSNIATYEIFNPSCPLFIKTSKGWL